MTDTYQHPLDTYVNGSVSWNSRNMWGTLSKSWVKCWI